jgi:hypothetical protein
MRSAENCWPHCQSDVGGDMREAFITQWINNKERDRNYEIGHPKRTGRSQVDAAAGPYQIVQRLPAAEDGEFHYEIRSAVELVHKPI